jgi:hypothetical protein
MLVGFDAHKLVKGRKRHMLVDTLDRKNSKIVTARELWSAVLAA